MRDEMPAEIQSLIAQCEANVVSFDNDQMSAALHFAETLWNELDWIANEAPKKGLYHGGETYYGLNQRIANRAKDALARKDR